MGPVEIDLLELDFVYPTYRMEKAYVDQVRLPKQLYFHTWCPRLVQKSLTNGADKLKLSHDADISRKTILFFTDLRLSDVPALAVERRRTPATDLQWSTQIFRN